MFSCSVSFDKCIWSYQKEISWDIDYYYRPQKLPCALYSQFPPPFPVLSNCWYDYQHYSSASSGMSYKWNHAVYKFLYLSFLHCCWDSSMLLLVAVCSLLMLTFCFIPNGCTTAYTLARRTSGCSQFGQFWIKLYKQSLIGLHGDICFHSSLMSI